MNYQYTVNASSEEQIYSHLMACSGNYSPPLNEKVNIVEYSKRISELSIKYESWSNDVLIGLIAAYFNDARSNNGFITNVSIVKEYMKQGIASKLLYNCIEYAKSININNITLEVNRANGAAISLYKKYNFIEHETRKESIMMVLKLK